MVGGLAGRQQAGRQAGAVTDNPAPAGSSVAAGRYITVVAAPQAQPTPLSLCGVQLLGAAQLAPSQHMLHPAAQLVIPPSLRPNFTLPIDGDSATCLEAPAAAGNGSSNSSSGGGSSSWQLQLEGTYPLLAIQLEASAAANGSLVVSLVDAGGGVAASWRAPHPAAAGAAGSGSSHSNASGNQSSAASSSVASWELPAVTHAAAVRIEGFASLCELRLLAAAARAATSYLLAPLPAPQSSGSNSNASSGGSDSVPGWQARDAAPADSPTHSGSSAALFDGDVRTCFTAQPLQAAAAGSSGSGAPQAAAVEVLLDRPYW